MIVVNSSLTVLLHELRENICKGQRKSKSNKVITVMHLSLVQLAKVKRINNVECSLTICKLAPNEIQMLLSHGSKSR